MLYTTVPTFHLAGHSESQSYAGGDPTQQRLRGAGNR